MELASQRDGVDGPGEQHGSPAQLPVWEAATVARLPTAAAAARGPGLRAPGIRGASYEALRSTVSVWSVAAQLRGTSLQAACARVRGVRGGRSIRGLPEQLPAHCAVRHARFCPTRPACCARRRLRATHLFAEDPAASAPCLVTCATTHLSIWACKERHPGRNSSATAWAPRNPPTRDPPLPSRAAMSRSLAAASQGGLGHPTAASRRRLGGALCARHRRQRHRQGPEVRRGWGVELLVPRREHRQPLAPLHARTAAAGTLPPGTQPPGRRAPSACGSSCAHVPATRTALRVRPSPLHAAHPGAPLHRAPGAAPAAAALPRRRAVRCHPPHNVPPPLPRSSRRGPNAKLMLFIVLMAGAVLFLRRNVRQRQRRRAGARPRHPSASAAGSSSGAPT